MGIPQSDTLRSGSTLGWVLGGQQHKSTGVVKQSLPVVDAEDGQLWDIQKYERQELAKMSFSNGIFLGNVWGDGANRNSFKVSYAAGNITVLAGRAIVNGKRVDLGLGGTFDGNFTNVFALPIIGNEKIIYLDIFERITTPPPAFAPAGTGMDLNIYADFSIYNTANAAIKEQNTFVGGPLPVAAAGHFFLEIGRVSNLGAVSDTRKMSHLKDPQNPNVYGFYVIPQTSNGRIGDNCTHTDINLAIADLSSSMINSDANSSKFLFIGGSVTINIGGLTIPAGVHILSAATIQRKVEIAGVQGSGSFSVNTDYGWTPLEIPEVVVSVAVTGSFQTASNIKITTLGGFITSFASIYSGCKISSLFNLTILQGIYYDCDINYLSGSTGQLYMERCRWTINSGTTAVVTSNIFCMRCSISIVTLSPAPSNTNFILLSSGVFTMRNSIVEYGDVVGVSTNNNFFSIAGGTGSFTFYHVDFRCYNTTSSSSTSSLFKFTGSSVGLNILSHCDILTQGFDCVVNMAKPTFCNLTIEHSSIRSLATALGVQAPIIIQQPVGGAQALLLTLNDCIIESSNIQAIKITGAAPDIGTINIVMQSTTVIGKSAVLGTFHSISQIISSGNYSVKCYNSTFTSDNARAMHLNFLGAGTLTTKFFNCVFISDVNTGIGTNVNINLANSTYDGPILDGGTAIAQIAGAGANASNVQV